MIINMEWGNFSQLPLTRYDARLNKDSPNPGRQHLEKMVSGMYLGEIVRLVIREMAARDLWRPGPERLGLEKPYGLSSEALSLLAEGKDPWEGETGGNLKPVEREMINRIGWVVALRSARIAASALSAVITWMDSTLDRKHTVAVDGALFEKYPGYRLWMTDLLKEIFGNKAENIRLVLNKDGSGIGAAIVGAVAGSL
jgi:hexokinase